MSILKKIWVGVKIGLGVAITLQQAKVIRIKELGTIKDVVEGIDEDLVKYRRELESR